MQESWEKNIIFAMVDDVIDVTSDKQVNLRMMPDGKSKEIFYQFSLPDTFNIPHIFELSEIASKKGFNNQSKAQIEAFVKRFDQSLKDLAGKVVCLRVAINKSSSRNEFLKRDNKESYSCNRKIVTDDWYITEFISLDMKHDLEELFQKHDWSHQPTLVTELPVYEYLLETYQCSESSRAGIGKYLGYEINRKLFHIKSVKEKISLRRSNQYLPFSEDDTGVIRKSLIVIYPEHNNFIIGESTKLTLLNIEMIFDRFFRPLRSESPHIYHFISVNMEICIYGYDEKVSMREDTSGDWSVRKVITLMRIGDNLNLDMQTYLRNPIQGVDISFLER